jgi:alpha-L-rhamnosidase
MNSRNHIMFGSCGEWFYSSLAGLRQLPGSVGYQHILIQPPSADVLLYSPVTRVSGTLNFGKGNITAAWQRQGGSICNSAPGNILLTVHL